MSSFFSGHQIDALQKPYEYFIDQLRESETESIYEADGGIHLGTWALGIVGQRPDDSSNMGEMDEPAGLILATFSPWLVGSLDSRSLPEVYTGVGYSYAEAAPANVDRWLEITGPKSVSDTSAGERGALERLVAQLRASFLDEPVEDGITHEAEKILENATSLPGQERSLGRLFEICTDDSAPAFAASVLRCLGRLEHSVPPAWQGKFVTGALHSADFEIRDAAVQAAESWGSGNLIDILMSHDEPESWLANYISRVTSHHSS